MKIAVSSIAWSDAEHPAAVKKLSDLGLSDIELVPGRILASPGSLEIVSDANLSICAFQGVLFNTKDLSLFNDQAARENLANHLLGLDEFAIQTGAKSLVFGAPKNRLIDPTLPYAESENVAIEFFRKLGDRLKSILSVEAIAESYGCNFLTNTDQLGRFIQKVNHPKIQMNFDLGVAIENKENLEQLAADYHKSFAHAHVSEPKLVVPGQNNEFHEYHSKFAEVIEKYAINGNLVSIEMLRDNTITIEDQLEQVVMFTKAVYGG